MTTQIETGKVVAGTTGAGGWDVDVTVILDGVRHEGEVTLLPAKSDGVTPSAWGGPENWISNGLLGVLRDLDSDSFSDVLGEIEMAAFRAVKASGIDAAERA